MQYGTSSAPGPDSEDTVPKVAAASSAGSLPFWRIRGRVPTDAFPQALRSLQQQQQPAAKMQRLGTAAGGALDVLWACPVPGDATDSTSGGVPGQGCFLWSFPATDSSDEDCTALSLDMVTPSEQRLHLAADGGGEPAAGAATEAQGGLSGQGRGCGMDGTGMCADGLGSGAARGGLHLWGHGAWREAGVLREGRKMEVMAGVELEEAQEQQQQLDLEQHRIWQVQRKEKEEEEGYRGAGAKSVQCSNGDGGLHGGVGPGWDDCSSAEPRLRGGAPPVLWERERTEQQGGSEECSSKHSRHRHHQHHEHYAPLLAVLQPCSSSRGRALPQDHEATSADEGAAAGNEAEEASLSSASSPTRMSPTRSAALSSTPPPPHPRTQTPPHLHQHASTPMACKLAPTPSPTLSSSPLDPSHAHTTASAPASTSLLATTLTGSSPRQHPPCPSPKLSAVDRQALKHPATKAYNLQVGQEGWCTRVDAQSICIAQSTLRNQHDISFAARQGCQD